LNARIKGYIHTVYMERRSQNLTIFIVIWVYRTWEEELWEQNFYIYVYGVKKTGSRIYQYKK